MRSRGANVSDQSEDAWPKKHPWVAHIIGPAMVSIVLGIGASWMSTRLLVAQYGERINALQRKTKSLEKSKASKTQMRHLKRRMKKNTERIEKMQHILQTQLTSVETKIDLLLDNKLDVEVGENGKTSDSLDLKQPKTPSQSSN